jgi:hypothetical protein
MGIQDKGAVALVRHAYVALAHRDGLAVERLGALVIAAGAFLAVHAYRDK